MPKRAVRVELALAEGAPREVELFVAEDQSVGHLLEAGQDFLPAHDVASGSWIVIGRAAVQWVRLQPGDALELFDHRQDVRVALVGGGRLEGSLLYSSPPERARVVDHLNEPGRFLDLWQGERLCLVRKALIVELGER